jgi:hypothetical protein
MIQLWGKHSEFHLDFFLRFRVSIDDHQIVVEGSVDCESTIPHLFSRNQRIIDNVLQAQFDKILSMKHVGNKADFIAQVFTGFYAHCKLIPNLCLYCKLQIFIEEWTVNTISGIFLSNLRL